MKLKREIAAMARDHFNVIASNDFDATCAHRIMQALAQIMIKFRQHQIAPCDECDFHSQALQKAAKFNADITGPNNRERFRQRIPFEKCIRIFSQRNARRCIRERRRTAGCNQHIARANEATIRKRHFMRRFERRALCNNLNAIFF